MCNLKMQLTPTIVSINFKFCILNSLIQKFQISRENAELYLIVHYALTVIISFGHLNHRYYLHQSENNKRKG